MWKRKTNHGQRSAKGMVVVALSIRPSYARYSHARIRPACFGLVCFCWNSDALSGEPQIDLYFSNWYQFESNLVVDVKVCRVDHLATCCLSLIAITVNPEIGKIFGQRIHFQTPFNTVTP